MLNGLDPIIIFQFYKLSELPASIAGVPIVSSVVDKIGFVPIPIYLSERLTGLMLDTQDKNIDIETTTEAVASGAQPVVNQKPINSTVRINLQANKDSIGLTLLSAMADLILPKLVSKEYAITYLNGAVTVFAGQLHSFNIQENSNDTRANITIELVRGGVKTQETQSVPVVTPVQGSVPL